MYSVYFETPFGITLRTVRNIVALEWVKIAGDVGALVVDLLDTRDVAAIADARLVLYRRSRSANERIMTTFVRYIERHTDKGGRDIVRVVAHDENDILARRIVAYAAGSAQAAQTSPADDIMKQIVSENLIGDAIAARDLTTSVLSRETKVGAGDGITKSFAWRNVLRVLQDIQAQTNASGNEVFFAVESFGADAFRFRTQTQQLGADRASANRVVFSLASGNLSSPSLARDYRDEASYVYAGGGGQGSDRNVQEAEDADRVGLSPFGRIEVFKQATQAASDAAVLAEASDELARRRPQRRFTADIFANNAAPYGGGGWKFGDRVIVQYAGEYFEAVIRAVRATLNERGEETITARVEGVASI